ncbi:MAG: response regulator [Bacteroidales bacterium]
MEDLPKNTQTLHAICIDDDATAHEILSLFLADHYTIDFAANGNMALGMIKENIYSVIFLDINLGRDVMDGLELLKLIRQVHGYEKTTVVALTAYAMRGDREEFLAAGCDYYISKPFSRASLMQVMSQIA